MGCYNDQENCDSRSYDSELFTLWMTTFINEYVLIQKLYFHLKYKKVNT